MWIIQIINKRNKKLISEHTFNSQIDAYKFKRIKELKYKYIRGRMIDANTDRDDIQN
jgi:hypothetical protein